MNGRLGNNLLHFLQRLLSIDAASLWIISLTPPTQVHQEILTFKPCIKNLTEAGVKKVRIDQLLKITARDKKTSSTIHQNSFEMQR